MDTIFFRLCLFAAAVSFGRPVYAQSGADGPPTARRLFVDGVCGMCEERIEKAAAQTPGVLAADWDLDTRQLTVSVDAAIFDEDRLHQTIANAGHDTERLRAPEAAYEHLHECCKYRDPAVRGAHEPAGPAATPTARRLFVDGVCGMCEERIEKAAAQTPGVLAADWDLDTRQLTVSIDAAIFDEDRLHQTIANAGHDTERLRAPEAAYEHLHECCKYRDPAVRGAHEPAGPSAGANARTLFVDGVCGMCKTRIEKTAAQTRGVLSAGWDMEARQLTVRVDPAVFDEERLHRNLANAGHDTEKARAPEAAYNRLDDCCRYRDPAVRAEHHPDAAGEDVSGVIFWEGRDGKREALTGVNVFWLGTNEGATTDEQGRFQLARVPGAAQLVASYVGLNSDTIDMTGQRQVQIVLADAVTLATVEVRHRRMTTEVSFIDPIKTRKISSQELLKAACCNLSESFETTPSVDVSFTDAVTGTRQIEMLGLAGPYVQLTRESMPDIRGLSALYGLTYIPGPWIEGIQLSMGAGSVVNGYESIAGQINVELKKPETSERAYLNLYANEGGRLEGNANISHAFSERLLTGVLVHGKLQRERMDRNGDGFLDNSLDRQFIGVNRWKFIGKNGLQGQFGLRGAYIDQQSGQLNFNPDEDRNASQLWGAGLETRRLEAWMKIGKVFPDRPYASIGLQMAGLVHDHASFFGRRRYDADQRMAYANLIYQNIIGDTRHQYRAGLSFQYDNFREVLHTTAFDRNEFVPGAFFEYTFLPNEKFTLVAGLRGDHHNLFGAFVTPRLHLRYAFSENTVLRASAGRGQRTASIIAENIGALASSRTFVVEGRNTTRPYGLDAEVAWNTGLNLTQNIGIAGRTAVLSLDAYHTRFQNQIVVDYDQNPRELRFYNLDGASFSNSIQTQFDVEIIPRLDLRLAYRFNDVQTTYAQGRLEKPLIARHRAFLNTAYETGNSWKFDLTLNWLGPKRIPTTEANPAAYRLPGRSPGFLLTNAQISKTWKNRFDLYLGAENLFDFRQDNPILAADAPFSPYFDASLVWGPIFGRMTYAGLRWRWE